MLLCCHLQDQPGLLSRAERASLPQRREKAARIRSPKGKAASLAAGLLLRHGLFLHGLAGVPVETGPQGKPFLRGNPLFISLSHSGDYAACALSAVPVGVDIQRVVPVSERAIRRFCSGEELSWLAAQPDSARAAIELWALKESYLKASGLSTEAVFAASFSVGEDGVVSGPRGWSFTLYDQIEGYCLALCEKTV